MYGFEFERLRRSIEEGASLDATEQRRLLDAVTELIRAARLPPEFLIRVHRDEQGIGWSAEHPLFLASIRARHPADTLVRAGLELRRGLERSFPEFSESEPAEPKFLRRQRLTEEVWDTLTRMDPGPETVVALSAALEALEEARREASELRYGESLRRAARDLEADPEERNAARADLRRRHAARLAAVGVEGADVSWRDDAFGPVEEFEVELPTLVVGFNVPVDWPNDPDVVDGFTSGRWIALEHRWRNDDLWSGDDKHVRLVAQPLAATREAELALRRVADLAPSGQTVQDHVAYHRAVADHLPGVSVDHVSGWVSPAALPIDADSLHHLVADVPDLGSPGLFFWHPQVYWLS